MDLRTAPRPGQIGWGGGASAATSAAVGAAGSTIGSLADRLWEGLWSAGGSPCPLCACGTLRLRDGAGRCDSCGSVLG